LVSGCLTTKRLQGNEKLLYNQTVEAPKGFNKEGLNDLFVQKANDRLGPLPISVGVGIYYYGKKKITQRKNILRRERRRKGNLTRKLPPLKTRRESPIYSTENRTTLMGSIKR